MTDPYDPSPNPPVKESVAASRIGEAAEEVKQQAKVVVDQAVSKAKEVYDKGRDIAGQRAAQARSAIEERPYASVGLVFLAGLVVGHLLNARSPKVIYLRDRGGSLPR